MTLSIPCTESCFPLVVVLDADQVIGTSKIDFGEYMLGLKSIEKLKNKSNG